MTFRITGLSPEPFKKFFDMSDDNLREQGVLRYVVDSRPGFPDRITLADMEIGQTALLLNYEHLPVESPYRASHAIFVKEGAEESYDAVGAVPEVLARRTLSLRGIDGRGHIVVAELAERSAIAPAIRRILDQEDVAYIHAHFAQRGCFAAAITRA